MEKEKINYIREYYKFGNEFPDLEIEKELGDSLGAVCFDIKKAKTQLAKSVTDCFPKLRNETQKIKFTESKTAFRNINRKDVSDIEWKKRVEQALEIWKAKVSKVKSDWGIYGYVGADDIVYCLESELIKINSQPTWQDQPTKDGYYWFKSNEFGTEIVEVINFPDMPLVMEIGTSEKSSTYSTTGKWYGPIAPPKECNP